MQFLYTTKIKPLEVNVSFLDPLETSENQRFFLFSGDIKGSIELKWVKQVKYWREWYNLMSLS